MMLKVALAFPGRLLRGASSLEICGKRGSLYLVHSMEVFADEEVEGLGKAERQRCP